MELSSIHSDRYMLKLYTPVSPFQKLEYAPVLFTVELFIPPYRKVQMHLLNFKSAFVNSTVVTISYREL